MKNIKVSYHKAESLIKEADILLYRRPNFPKLGFFVALYGGTIYSHVGLAHWCHKQLNCIEFKEFIGSRNISIKSQIDAGYEIDIYRANSSIDIYKVQCNPITNLDVINRKFTPFIARLITNYAEKLVGQPYGWTNIWKIARTFIPGIRIFINKDTFDKKNRIWVCSTLVTDAYKKFYVDLCPLISDEYSQPSDIARSSVLNYLFTVTK